MRLTINRTYEMEAAHRLTAGVPEGHQCRRPHGHRYRLTVSVSGEPNADGMVIEYSKLDALIAPVIGAIDHNDLNTLHERTGSVMAKAVSENPTVENILAWVQARLLLLIAPLPDVLLERLVLEEDSRSSAEWR